MGHRENPNLAFAHPIDETERKPPEYHAPQIMANKREGFREVHEPGNRVLNRSQEGLAQALDSRS